MLKLDIHIRMGGGVLGKVHVRIQCPCCGMQVSQNRMNVDYKLVKGAGKGVNIRIRSKRDDDDD